MDDLYEVRKIKGFIAVKHVWGGDPNTYETSRFYTDKPEGAWHDDWCGWVLQEVELKVKVRKDS